MLHDYPPLSGGGLALAALDLALLVPGGQRVQILSSRTTDHFADDAAELRGDSTAPGGTVSIGLARPRPLVHAWRSADVLVVHWTFSFRWLSTWSLWLGPRLGKQVVAVLHTTPAHLSFNRARRWPRPVQRAMLKFVVQALGRCSQVIALSTAQEAALASIGLTASSVLPLPVSCGKGPGQRRNDTENLRIGVAGELSTIKGTDELVRALPFLTISHNVVIAGTGPLQACVDSAVEALPLGQRLRVTLLGSLRPRDMPRFYEAVDCLLVPSRSEAQCRVALEAMLAGVIVVARPIEALGGLVEHGVSGYHIDPADPVSILSVLDRVATNPSEADTIRQRARSVADEINASAMTGWRELLAAELAPADPARRAPADPARRAPQPRPAAQGVHPRPGTRC